jgi:DTW domain-containing protein YfiP
MPSESETRVSSPAAPASRLMCAKCGRPLKLCLCAHVVEIATRTRVLILQHPRESTVPVGTARLAELGLVNLERHVGIEFANHAAVRAALANPLAPPILLFPGEGAKDLTRQAPTGPTTLVVIDGSWSEAAKTLRRNPELARLPRYTLGAGPPSRYRIRREPREECLSTIEAIARALATLEGDDRLVADLMRPFEALVEQQLGFASQRAEHRHRKVRRSPRPRPLPEWLRQRAEQIVVDYGEANAWPRGSALGAHPEIVHWAAERLYTGERFEAFIAPRRPLSPAFTLHTGLPRSRVEEGEPFAEFCRRWEAFLAPGDLLCGWGLYSSGVLRAEGVPVPEQLDLRLVARRYLGHKPGEVERAAAELGEPPATPWVDGRTGIRLAALAAVARALLRVARAGCG